MEEISGSEEMQIASKHGAQRKEYPICLHVSTPNLDNLKNFSTVFPLQACGNDRGGIRE